MADLADGFTPLPGIHVVIVDDNDDARKLLTHVLQYCGAVVTCVGSAEDALVVLDRVRPDVIVSDLAMPRMDGYTFIRSVREMPAERGGTIPAIAITAFTEDYDSGKAYAAGFDAYLRKPLNLTSFCELVAKVAKGGRDAADTP